MIQVVRREEYDPVRGFFMRGERESWNAADVDLDVDMDQWVGLPAEEQVSLILALAPVAAATQRMAAGIAALLPAAPTGEHELVLTAHAAELWRHIALIDRVCAEVMAFEGANLRARIQELRDDHGDARALAKRIATMPDGMDPFLDGVAAWYVDCGRQASLARRALCARLARDEIMPGLAGALELAERDGLRHMEFAGHVLEDAYTRRPADREVVELRLTELALPV